MRRSLIIATTLLLTVAALADGATLGRRHSFVRSIRDERVSGGGSSAALPLATAGAARVLKFADPLGVAASVNTPVQSFQIAFSYSSVRTGTLRLKAVLIKPVTNGEFVKGGCSACTGPGRFLPYTIHGDLFTERIRGTILMTRRTRIVEALIRPGSVGRFKLYGVSVGPPTNPVLLEQGCISADALPGSGPTSRILLVALLHPSVLPQVPCHGGPRGDNVTFFRPPVELSPNAVPVGGFSGHAGGARWLSVFQANQPCAPDPLAEATLTSNHVFWHVSGDFRKGFRGVPATKPGFFCAYLQSGSTFAGIPSGLVGLKWSVPYYAGDTLAITGQSTVSPGQQVVDTFDGVASAHEELWSFDSFTPCAATAEGEFPTAAGVGNTPVFGSFSITSTAIPLSHSFFRCAYLNVGIPTNGKPTGPTVARASLAVTVQ